MRYYIHLFTIAFSLIFHTVMAKGDVTITTDFTFTGDLCPGSGIIFNDNSSTSTGDITGWLWDFKDGSSGSTTENPTHIFESSGTYAVRLTVFDSNGNSDFAEIDVIIGEAPELLIDVTSTDNCLLTTQTFESDITYSGVINSIEWDYGDNTITTGANGSHDFDATGTHIITLTVEGDNGCTTSISEEITIYEEPVADFVFTNQCGVAAYTFTNTSFITLGNLTYEWDFGDGSAISTLEDPTHTYADPDSYDVTLTVTSGLGSCETVIIKNVEVFDNPTADFSVNNACFEEAIIFSNNSVNASNYFWDFDDGTSSTEFEPAGKIYENPGTYFIELTVESNEGCTDRFTQRVDVFAKPVPSFLVNSQCDQGAVLFNNLTSENEGALTYQWDFGDSHNSNEQSPEHLYENPGTYTVTLTATTATNCSDILTKELTVLALPQPDFTVENVCYGETSSFTNQSTAGSGTIASYEWDFGDLSGSSIENPDKQYLNPGSYDVTLTVISGDGCEASITRQAVVEDVPIANFQVDDVCFGDPILTTNISDGNGSTLTYEWNFGDGNQSISTSPNHVYSSGGVYIVSLIASTSAGCQDTYEQSVAIYNAPQVDAGVDTTISRGSSVQLNAQGGNTYSWSPIAGLDNSNVSNPIARPLEDTDYVVLVTDAFGCQNRDTIRITLEEDFIIVPTNIITPDENGQNDTWVIQNADAFDQVWVRVYDRYGVLVFEDDDYQNTWRGARGTDILPDGTYYYLITFPGQEIKYSGSLTIIRNN